MNPSPHRVATRFLTGAEPLGDLTGRIYVRSGLGPKTWFYAKGPPQDDFVSGVRVSDADAKATTVKVKMLDIGDLWKEIPAKDVPTDARAKLVKGGASKKILRD